MYFYNRAGAEDHYISKSKNWKPNNKQVITKQKLAEHRLDIFLLPSYSTGFQLSCFIKLFFLGGGGGGFNFLFPLSSFNFFSHNLCISFNQKSWVAICKMTGASTILKGVLILNLEFTIPLRNFSCRANRNQTKDVPSRKAWAAWVWCEARGCQTCVCCHPRRVAGRVEHLRYPSSVPLLSGSGSSIMERQTVSIRY